MDGIHAALDPRPCVAGLGQPRAERQQAFGKARLAVRRDKAEKLAVIGSELSMRSFTQSRSPLQHRVEYGLNIARRGVDDLQHLCGRRLLLQRLSCLSDK